MIRGSPGARVLDFEQAVGQRLRDYSGSSGRIGEFVHMSVRRDETRFTFNFGSQEISIPATAIPELIAILQHLDADPGSLTALALETEYPGLAESCAFKSQRLR